MYGIRSSSKRRYCYKPQYQSFATGRCLKYHLGKLHLSHRYSSEWCFALYFWRSLCCMSTNWLSYFINICTTHGTSMFYINTDLSILSMWQKFLTEEIWYIFLSIFLSTIIYNCYSIWCQGIVTFILSTISCTWKCI